MPQSIYTSKTIFAGPARGGITLNAAEQKRLRNYLIYLGLTDNTTPRRFYSNVNEDTTLVDLLDLHAERDGKATVASLPKIYTDLGNLAGVLVAGYKALLLYGVDLDSVMGKVKGVASEDLTKRAKEILSAADEGGFMPLLGNLTEAGLTYGDTFAAVSRDDKGRVWCYEKEAPSVFPVEYLQKINRYIVDYKVYESDAIAASTLAGIGLGSGEMGLVEYTEIYEPNSTMVYRDKKPVPEMSQAETGIDEPLFVMVGFPRSRSSKFGRAIIASLVETIVDMCGAHGSTLRNIRDVLTGWVVISGADAPAAIEKLLGAAPGQTPQAPKGGLVNPDNTKCLVGGDVNVQVAESTCASSMTPYLQMLDDQFAKKCPLYALSRLGANASGEAIRLSLFQLEAEIALLRNSVDEIVNSIVRLASLLRNEPWEDGYKVEINWGTVLPESMSEKIDNALKLKGAGIVPTIYVAKKLGLDADEDVKAWLEGEEARETARNTTTVAPNPFLGL